MNPASVPIGKLKALLFIASLGPLGRLAYAAVTGDFGPNPVEFLQRYTGTWTFNFLLLTLCISPLRALTGLHWLLRLRRMLGLFSFFYASLHFLSFIGFDHAFDPGEIARDVIKRPFVTVGFAAFVLLIPLAATSNALAIRRLGGRRWQDLHRAVYLIALLAVVHYFWLVKATALIYPIVYGLLVVLLLGWRILDRLRRNGPYPATAGISVRRSG
ncbi:MAG: sulfoxide reductase heme-binding subunit YedZ [Azonexus sp.]|nr:sulfoxide reductase heme-binding subunit YedZ [Betaproteobacteria bacterium]MBK8916860.1 sulfoxide reductase heme-binding subunit YedZ [Betaproteobacteria bacterium]MBP6036989.1 sulfoxide reductase heme-binding subunit YedZ [Azonexus sp.]MBP6907578.1 sulfoxide reductase heme-binding subunit YedZ [Azonexus sp.]